MLEEQRVNKIGERLLTHINYLTAHTHEYFCGDQPQGRSYGFVGRFDLRRSERALQAMRRARRRSAHIVWGFVGDGTS